MKRLIMIALVLGGCVADLPVEQQGSEDTTKVVAVTTVVAATDVEIIHEHFGPPEVATVEISVATLGGNLSAICAQSEMFPVGNVCSMICDPDRVVAKTISDGVDHGACVEYQCALSGNVNVNVGVCVP